MMKKVGAIFVLVAVPAWIYHAYSFSALRNGPFGDEFGSMGYPVPLRLQVVGWFAFGCNLIGVSLIAFGFTRRARQKSHGNTDYSS